MGLAGGDVGHLERHLQGGVGVLGHLRDLEVVAHDLVEELELAAGGGRLDDRAVLADLEGLGLAVGEQVGVVRFGLLDGVGAVRELVGCGLGGVGLLLVVPGGNDGLDNVAGLEPLVAHEDLVLGGVGDGELDAGERGAGVESVVGVAAQRFGGLELDVGLRHLDPAADHVVVAGAAGEVDHLAIGLNLSLHGPVGNEISLGCLGLDHGVSAAGQGARGSLGDICACLIIPLAGDGLHHLAAGVVMAVDEGVLARGVDDVVLYAVEGCATLGLGARLGVFLRHLQATLVPCEAHEHLGAGARVDAKGLEAGRNLALVRLDGLPSGAQKLAARPVLEVAAGAEDSIGLGALVGVRQEHMACHGVLIRAPAAAVVPGVGEHGRVEARGAVAEPHRCGEVGVAHAALAVGAGRGCGGSRVGAVGDLVVGVHVGRGVARVWDVVANGDVDATRCECAHRRRNAHAERQGHAHDDLDDLGGYDPLGCLDSHHSSLERDVFARHSGVCALGSGTAEPLAAVARRTCALGEALQVLAPVALDRVPDLSGHHLDDVL